MRGRTSRCSFVGWRWKSNHYIRLDLALVDRILTFGDQDLASGDGILKVCNEEVSVKDLTFEVGQAIRHGNWADLGDPTAKGGDPAVEDRAVGEGDLAV